MSSASPGSRNRGMRVLSSVLALLAVLPSAAEARTVIASNETGSEVLLEQVLQQQTQPLFAAIRSPSGSFGPLRVLTPPDFNSQQVAMDDAGGAVAMWYRIETQSAAARVLVATRPPGGRFCRPKALSGK